MKLGNVPLTKPGEELNQNYLFYGWSGTGKTVLASTFPKPVLFIDVNDRGSNSIVGTEGCYVANVTTLEELYSVIESLEEDCRFKTVVVDTISQVQDLVLNDVLATEGETSQRVWGKVGGDTKDLLSRIRDLNAITVFLAQIRESKQAGAIVEASPSLNGPQVLPSISKAVCSWAYLIGVTRIRESTKNPDQLVHTLLIGPDLDYITKYRVPKERKVPRELGNVTYGSLQKVLNAPDVPKSPKPADKAGVKETPDSRKAAKASAQPEAEVTPEEPEVIDDQQDSSDIELG